MNRPPEFVLDTVVEPTFAKDVVKAILAAIFFHRLFPSIRPKTRDLLDLTLPSVDDSELDALIENRTSSMIRSVESTPGASSAKTQIAVQFFEKKQKRKAWFSTKDEEVCWEQWLLDITLLYPRTESQRTQARKDMESALQLTILKIIDIVNNNKDHIPPITTSDYNPFPYKIFVPQKGDNWSGRFFSS
ncbi:hypothetical protein TWF506_001801 [Arthrobotrys conoides]|uniref:Autophagy-related protein 101 n=1 Tax=Arthrobotrys conoides TaxID=74498 RepID=A0AAN8NGZ9_9PEZI